MMVIGNALMSVQLIIIMLILLLEPVFIIAIQVKDILDMMMIKDAIGIVQQVGEIH